MMKKVKHQFPIILSLLMMCVFITSVSVSASGGQVNINTAGKEELMTLKGVGEKLAERIIEFRTAHPFENPEDIMKVKGVGQKIFDNNKDRIVVKNE